MKKAFSTLNYDAIIFDLFGTLIDNYTVQEYERVLSEMAAVLGAPQDDFVRLWLQTFYERAIGMFLTTEANIIHVCREIGVTTEPDVIARAATIRSDLTRRALVPRLSTLKPLTELRSRGYKIGLISDCSAEVPLVWESTPFARLVDAAIFSCVVGLKKPDSRIYQLACEILGVEPHRCIYVGDGSSRELSGASTVGMYPILVRALDDGESDAYRIDAEEWQGTRVLELREILTILD